MLTSRALMVAVAALAVFWFAFDSGYVNTEPAPPGRLVALGILGLVFTVSASVMHAAGENKRVPLIFGLALGLGTYVLMRTLTP